MDTIQAIRYTGLRRDILPWFVSRDGKRWANTMDNVCPDFIWEDMVRNPDTLWFTSSQVGVLNSAPS